MIRRTITFLLMVALIGAVASLVYLNPEHIEVWLTPQHSYHPTLGALVIINTMVGAALVFLLLLMREGRWALRQWSVNRERRHAERNAQLKTEARSLVLAGQFVRARALLSRAGRRSEPTLLDLLEYADTFVKEGAYAQARRTLEGGVEAFGNDPLLLHAIGKVCFALKDYDAAATALERAVESYPGSIALTELLRDVLVASGSWRRLEEVQYRLSGLKPDDREEKRRLVEYRFAAALRMPEDSREAALKAVNTMAPDFAPAFVERARLMAARGAQRWAIRMLVKAVRNNPMEPLLQELHLLLQGAGKQARLFKLYRKLIAARPDDGLLKLHVAARFLEADRTDEAAELLGHVDEAAGPALYLSLRAELCRKQGKPELAEKFYRKAVAVAAGIPLAIPGED